MNLIIIPLSFFLGAIFKFPGGDCTFSFIKAPHDPTVVIFGSNSSNVSLHWKCNIGSILLIKLSRYDPENPGIVTYLAHRSDSGENKISTNFTGRGLFFGSGCEATLLIFNVTVDDGKFQYRAEFSTINGNGKIDIKMLVAVHPRILDTDPTNKVVAVNESQPFNLSCNASGNPAPTLVWSKTSGSSLEFQDGTTLNVSSASSQHNGTYQCIATNLAGSDTATFVVVVQYKPARATIVPSGKNINVNETGSITLTCQAFDGNPDVYWYKWQYNGVDLPGGENGTLELISVNRNQSGNYTCIASNIIGMVNMSTLLTVQVPTKITIRPRQQTVCENQPVTISCDVEEGIPEPEVKLINNTDGTILMSSHNKSSNYSIGHISRHHSGSYSCLATNAAGTEKKTASLHVEVAAKISYITPTVIYERNTPVTLECSAIGEPSPNVTWINITDGLVLQNSTTETSYLKPNVSFHNKGTYRCVAKNKCGSDNRKMTINVYNDIKKTEWNLKLLKVLFLEAYTNIKSEASQQLVLNFIPKIVNESSAEGGKVIAIIKGSVIIHFVLYYNSTMSDNEIKRLLREAVADGKIGSYEVDPNSLKQLSAPTTPGPKKKGLPVTNGEEHKLGERHLSNPSVGCSNSALEHAPYVEDGPTVTRHQDKRSKEGKKPVPLYTEVDMSKKSKKKKPGQVLYADLDTFQPSVATEGSNTQQQFKKPKKHQTTDYASITDVIKEEGGKSVKFPIATSDRHISNNGSTTSEP